MKSLFRFFKRPMVLLFLSDLCSALPLSFPSLYLLSWVSFIPFFYLILKLSGRGSFLRAIGRGVFFGFWYHFFVYFWFVWLYPLDFAGLDSASSIGVLLLAWPGISFLHGCLFAIPTLLCHLFAKRVDSKPFLLFCASLGILAAQRIQGLSELAFPWIKVSLGQYRASALIQSASIFGMEGLDLLILSVSAALALCLYWKSGKRILSFSFALLLFFSNLAFGLSQLQKEGEGESVTVSSVQGCILSGEKWSDASNSLETYLSLTESVPEEADLVVWPESAVPVNLVNYPEFLEAYQALSAKIDTPIFMGCLWEIDGATSNSALLVSEDGVSNVYSKRILVPFGERMPYRKVLSTLFPALENINMLSDDLAAGSETALIDWDGKQIGTAICYESIFPDLVRESVADGAEILIVVTNDSWYEDSSAVWQHLAHAVFRSVENGRSLVRCANSGVSAFIDEKGRILNYLGPLEQGVLTNEVTFSSETTIFTRIGNVTFPLGCTFLAIWFVGILLKKEGRGKIGKSRRTSHH